MQRDTSKPAMQMSNEEMAQYWQYLQDITSSYKPSQNNTGPVLSTSPDAPQPSPDAPQPSPYNCMNFANPVSSSLFSFFSEDAQQPSDYVMTFLDTSTTSHTTNTNPEATYSHPETAESDREALPTTSRKEKTRRPNRGKDNFNQDIFDLRIGHPGAKLFVNDLIAIRDLARKAQHTELSDKYTRRIAEIKNYRMDTSVFATGRAVSQSEFDDEANWKRKNGPSRQYKNEKVVNYKTFYYNYEKTFRKHVQEDIARDEITIKEHVLQTQPVSTDDSNHEVIPNVPEKEISANDIRLERALANLKIQTNASVQFYIDLLEMYDFACAANRTDLKDKYGKRIQEVENYLFTTLVFADGRAVSQSEFNDQANWLFNETSSFYKGYAAFSFKTFCELYKSMLRDDLKDQMEQEKATIQQPALQTQTTTLPTQHTSLFAHGNETTTFGLPGETNLSYSWDN